MATIGYWICYPFSALVRLFYTLTNSYGLSLILFTLVIKLILLPFQMKSKKSMVRMGRMTGRVQEIQKKYANNQSKMAEELQKLYAEEGANPMSGCLWSFIPMPLLFALYYVIREPIKFFMNFGSLAAGTKVVTAAQTAIKAAGLTMTTLNKNGSLGIYSQIEMVKLINSNQSNGAISSFLKAHPHWVNVDYNFLGIDLSALPTSAFQALKTGITWAAIGLLLIPILSGALQLLVTKITMKTQPQTTGSAGATNKIMMYMMPLFSVYIGFILPAALGVYWIAQSAFAAIQEAILGKFYNGKLEAEENAHQKQIEDNRRRRQEEAKLRQEEQRKLTAKQQAAVKKKAMKATQDAKKGKKPSTNENGRVGDRPYARGRAFADEHYEKKQNGSKK